MAPIAEAYGRSDLEKNLPEIAYRFPRRRPSAIHDAMAGPIHPPRPPAPPPAPPPVPPPAPPPVPRPPRGPRAPRRLVDGRRLIAMRTPAKALTTQMAAERFCRQLESTTVTTSRVPPRGGGGRCRPARDVPSAAASHGELSRASAGALAAMCGAAEGSQAAALLHQTGGGMPGGHATTRHADSALRSTKGAACAVAVGPERPA